LTNHISRLRRIRYRRNRSLSPSPSAKNVVKSKPTLVEKCELEQRVGDKPLLSGIDDSRTVPIGSNYLAQFIHHWQPFSTWSLIRPCPFSSDIVQGLLGNCWFLSALALVAEKPELLKTILPTKAEEFERTRRATVRLFKQGKWYLVMVDDMLPVNRAGQLVFSQVNYS